MPVIANWKNKKEYPDEKNLVWNRITLNRFAWEFLRRNPKYQKDWNDYLTTCRSIIPKFCLDFPLSQKDINKLRSHPDHKHYDPPKLEGESFEAWSKRVKEGDYEKGEWVSLHIWYGEKWMINYIIDPFLPYSRNLMRLLSFETSPKVKYLSARWRQRNYDQTDHMIHPTITFNLALPLRPQIKSVYEILSKDKKYLQKEKILPLQKETPRKEWITYLRLLDAEDAGATKEEMADGLYELTKGKENNYENEFYLSKRVEKGLKVAKEWRDSLYQTIPALSTSKNKW